MGAEIFLVSIQVAPKREVPGMERAAVAMDSLLQFAPMIISEEGK